MVNCLLCFWDRNLNWVRSRTHHPIHRMSRHLKGFFLGGYLHIQIVMRNVMYVIISLSTFLRYLSRLLSLSSISSVPHKTAKKEILQLFSATYSARWVRATQQIHYKHVRPQKTCCDSWRNVVKVTNFWSFGASASYSCGGPAGPAAAHPRSGSGTVLPGGSGCCCPPRWNCPGCRHRRCRWRPWTPTSSRDSPEASRLPWSPPRAQTPGYPGSRPVSTEGTGCRSLPRVPGLDAGCSPSRCRRPGRGCGATCPFGSAAAAAVWLGMNSWSR